LQQDRSSLPFSFSTRSFFGVIGLILAAPSRWEHSNFLAPWFVNDQVVGVTDPLTGDEVLEERTIETTGGAIVDVLDGGGLTELGTGQAAREAAVVAGSDLAIDEEAEPIGVRHPGRLGIVLQFDEGIGHGGEAEGAQAIDGGVNEHADLS
jgi:hypothetical protein